MHTEVKHSTTNPQLCKFLLFCIILHVHIYLYTTLTNLSNFMSSPVFSHYLDEMERKWKVIICKLKDLSLSSYYDNIHTSFVIIVPCPSFQICMRLCIMWLSIIRLCLCFMPLLSFPFLYTHRPPLSFQRKETSLFQLAISNPIFYFFCLIKPNDYVFHVKISNTTEIQATTTNSCLY